MCAGNDMFHSGSGGKTSKSVAAMALSTVCVVAMASPASADLINKAVAAALFNGVAVTSQESTANVPITPARRALGVSVVAADFDGGVDGGPEVGAGDTLAFTIGVTNQGNVTLSGVAPKLEALTFAGRRQEQSNPAGEADATVALAPGETREFRLVYTLSAEDAYSAAGVENAVASVWSASASGGPVEIAQAERTDTIAAAPALEISKSYAFAEDNGAQGSADAGDIIVYSYIVRNVGNVALSDVHVVDRHGSDEAHALTLDSSAYAGALGNGEGQWDMSETTPAKFAANEDANGGDAVFGKLGVGGAVTFIYTHRVTQEEFDAQ